jgi:glycosyltransferase involved in cell wall biosynthesis
VNQFFWPDVAATAQLLSDLAFDAAEDGWEVSALAGTAPYDVLGGRRLPVRETVRGVSIERLPTSPLRRGLARDGASYASFLARVASRALRSRRGDVVLTLSTPPFVAVAGWLARRRGARFVYKVEDLYPDVAIALGAVRSRALATVLRRASRALLRSADAVVVLDDAMRARVERERGGERGLHVIPNWADGEAVRPSAPSSSAFRTSLGIPPGAVVFGYSGNLGRAHRFDALLEAARRLERRRPEAVFLFTGGGSQQGLVAAAARTSRNVLLRGFQPRERLGDVLAASDVHVVTLRPEVEGLLFPSKVAGVLAAGRPVLFLGDPGGALAREIREAGVGWCAPHDPDAVETTIESIASDPEGRAEKGRAARAHFERRYARAAMRARWLRVLEEVRA